MEPWVLSSGYIAIMLLKYAGMWGDSLVVMMIAYGAVIILMFGVMIWRHRTYVASRIRGCITDTCEDAGWFIDLFASNWHLMALAYLFIVWILGSGRLLILGPGFNKVFIISLLIVPIYLVIDRASGWVISAIIGSLQKGNGSVEEKAADGTKITTPPGSLQANHRSPGSTGYPLCPSKSDCRSIARGC
jgi:hypothetical protein